MAANISFASFNLYNFQKADLPTYRGKKPTQKEYNAKKKWTQEMLLKVNADVVAFQELWHPDCLENVLYSKDKPEERIPALAKYKTIYISEKKTTLVQHRSCPCRPPPLGSCGKGNYKGFSLRPISQSG